MYEIKAPQVGTIKVTGFRVDDNEVITDDAFDPECEIQTYLSPGRTAYDRLRMVFVLRRTLTLPMTLLGKHNRDIRVRVRLKPEGQAERWYHCAYGGTVSVGTKGLAYLIQIKYPVTEPRRHKHSELIWADKA